MTEYVGLHTRLKPGMELSYEKAHADVWPELLAAQREFGIKRYLIFREGLELFHSIECESFEDAVAKLAVHPVDILWQAEMAKYVVTREDLSLIHI